MVAINNAADWEVDLAPGLLLQQVDLTPYVNTSALKVKGGGEGREKRRGRGKGSAGLVGCWRDEGD